MPNSFLCTFYLNEIGFKPTVLYLFQVLKVAILAEKYAVDYTWYVDVILNLIRMAGDYVSEEVWYRVIQIVINRDDVQGYAAKTVFEVSAIVLHLNFLYNCRKMSFKCASIWICTNYTLL